MNYTKRFEKLSSICPMNKAHRHMLLKEFEDLQTEIKANGCGVLFDSCGMRLICGKSGTCHECQSITKKIEDTLI